MPRSPRRPAGEPPMRHSRRRAETSSRGLDGRRNEFLEAPRDAPRTRPGEVVRRRPRGAPDGARRKPWKVPAVTLDDHLRGASRTPTASSATTPPGGFRRPLGQSPRHSPPRPLRGVSAHAFGTPGTILRGGQGDPRGTPRRASPRPSERSRRTSPRARPRPSQEAGQTTSAASATTLHGALTDHLNTPAQHPPKRSYKDPSGQLHEPRPPPSTEPRRPPQYARSVRSEKGLRKTPRDHCELRHNPPQRPPRRPQDARSTPSEKVV